jgi:hypothetical protein
MQLGLAAAKRKGVEKAKALHPYFFRLIPMQTDVPVDNERGETIFVSTVTRLNGVLEADSEASI